MTTTPWTICPDCGSRWNSLIPEMHTITCPRTANTRKAPQPMTIDCPDCHGSGHDTITRDPDTNQGVAEDCGFCGGRGVVFR